MVEPWKVEPLMVEPWKADLELAELQTADSGQAGVKKAALSRVEP